MLDGELSNLISADHTIPEVGEFPAVEEFWRHSGGEGESLVLEVDAHADCGAVGGELGLGGRLEEVRREVLPLLELARQSNLYNRK